MNEITVTDYPPHDEDWYPGKPGTRYTFETALADATRYVEGFPLESQPPATRVFMHAMLDYFKELGVPRGERDAILAAYLAATGAVWTDSFNKGWDAGFDVGVRQNTPPF